MSSPGAPAPGLARVATLLLALVAVLAVVTGFLAVRLHRLSSRAIRLEELTADQRLRLVKEAERIVPAVYQSFPGLEPPGFFTMEPDTRYDRKHPAAGPAGVLGDVFTTNGLGFRSRPVTPRVAGQRRLVVVGDSWTFGPGVRADAVFSERLQELLDPEGDAWRVINLGMMGWNTRNELTALRILFSRLDPDVVVICPTSNDIDDSFRVWNGRLVMGGFQSGAVFRDSWEYERRWVEAFRALQEAVDFLGGRGIPTLVYFLAEWRELAPYYAARADSTFPYVVVPTPYIVAPYRLSFDVDAGRHATAEGHRLLASYLYNALLELGAIGEGESIPLEHAVRFRGRTYDPELAEAEFRMWREHLPTADLIALNGDLIAHEALFSLAVDPERRTLRVELELLDEPALYPLRVEVGLASPEGRSFARRFERYDAEPEAIELRRPESLDGYDFMEVRLRADRVVAPADGWSPASMRRPRISLR